MDEKPIADLSFDRTPSSVGDEDGYELWLDLPPKSGDATTPELQTLCQGAILLGRIAERMGWDWNTLIRNVDHLSAPLDGFLLLEVGATMFRSERFRQALTDAVMVSGLNPSKVKIVDDESASVYVLSHGLPAL